MSSAKETLGQRLFRARHQLSVQLGREVTQTAVARVMGVKPNAVSRWESGEKRPNLATIERLAALLRVSPGYLAFGEGGVAQHEGQDVPTVTTLPATPDPLHAMEQVGRGAGARKSARKSGGSRRA